MSEQHEVNADCIRVYVWWLPWWHEWSGWNTWEERAFWLPIWQVVDARAGNWPLGGPKRKQQAAAKNAKERRI